MNAPIHVLMPLSELETAQIAHVRKVRSSAPHDAIARRLSELGFVADERVSVVAHAPLGADPLLIQVGGTRFALRRSEAARVLVELTS